MNISKDRAEETLQKFHDEYNGKHGIWGMATGPAPNQYNAWGKHVDNVTSWGIHVYTSNADAMETLPKEYENVPIMIFVDLEILQKQD